MNDFVTVTGIVGNDPRPYVTAQGLAILNFRLASTRRVFDKSADKWVDAETNWYTVTTFRRLAENAAVSIRKGEHVFVHGRLRMRAWHTSEKSGTTIEIDADAIGHDLNWYVTRASKMERKEPMDDTLSDAYPPIGGSAEDPRSFSDAELAVISGDSEPGEVFAAVADTEKLATNFDINEGVVDAVVTSGR